MCVYMYAACFRRYLDNHQAYHYKYLIQDQVFYYPSERTIRLLQKILKLALKFTLKCSCMFRFTTIISFLYFADRASQYIYLNINRLDALNFIMSLFHASTCFEQKCSSSGGQNCTIQSLVSSHL